MSHVIVIKEIPTQGREVTDFYEHMDDLLAEMNQFPDEWDMDNVRVYRVESEVFIGNKGFSIQSEQKL